MIIAPKLDWHANPDSISRVVESAREAYKLIGDEHGIALKAPDQPCQFDNATQTTVIEWLKKSTSSR
jgi:hypothetical protein